MEIAEAHTQRKRKPANPPTASAQVVDDLSENVAVDIPLFGAALRKLSLKETGELMRSIVRAHRSSKPNREQRMLLAIFTREEGEPCKP